MNTFLKKEGILNDAQKGVAFTKVHLKIKVQNKASLRMTTLAKNIS